MPGLDTPNDSPEVVFRGVLPSDSLLATVREQDALLCSVVRMAPTARRTIISREAASYRVVTTGQFEGRSQRGQSDHMHADVALRSAYSELLRSMMRERGPMQAWAA
jgi:archaeosine-15-forming tRNA-guanine transglycosylase